LGYGVVTSSDGYPLIEGNTFLSNRHAIAGDGSAFSGYRAWLNLVQLPAPHYDGDVEQDFDMHGLGAGCPGISTHCGGVAGEYIDISRNTFLGGDRFNFMLRGTPNILAQFDDNVTVGKAPVKYYGVLPSALTQSGNQTGSSNLTDRLGVGDFDGDGKQDLFMATGVAWYYAPAGTSEWRFLNAQTEKIDSLLFGDFDGDGRTDVFTQHGRDWLVSWGGRSKWEKINESDARMTDFAIGDFNGDHRADIFYADGTQWYVSYGGVGSLTPINSSAYRIGNLRFGDFNGDGNTDVFGVVSGQWMVSYSGTSAWTPLRPKLSDSVASLVVADFNGDGRVDVATSSCSLLYGCVSYSGTGDWVSLLPSSVLPLSSAVAIGRFNGNAGVDVLMWHDNYLEIVSGPGAPHRQSRQDMR
jgi:hypothetical protein